MANFYGGGVSIPIPDANDAKKTNIVISSEDSRSLNTIFSYKHLSLKSSQFCYNNPKIDLSDFYELFKIKKELSSLNFTEIENDKKYHFHYVKPKKINKLLNVFKAEISKETGKPIKQIEVPDIYQFAVYTTTEKAPRVFGFLGKDGLFYVIWLDLEHEVYGKVPNKR